MVCLEWDFRAQENRERQFEGETKGRVLNRGKEWGGCTHGPWVQPIFLTGVCGKNAAEGQRRPHVVVTLRMCAGMSGTSTKDAGQ